MTAVGREQLDHPALGSAGGATLHTSINTIYTNVSDDMPGRYRTYSSIANSTVTTVTHNFGVQFEDLSVWIYTGTHPTLVRVEDPVASGWTIAATGGTSKTQIDVTAPSSGGPHTFAVWIMHGRLAKILKDIKDIDFSTAPQDGQALVYNSTTGKWTPGASGDSSFKLQDVTTPNVTLKGGYLNLELTGEELATYSGSGATSTSYGVDLTMSLTTILGSSPANATTYYLYIDKTTLGSEQTLTDNGRKLFQVTISNFKLFTTAPTAIDSNKYIYVGFVRSATTGTVWSGSGAAFGTAAKFKDLMALGVQDTGEFNWVQNSRFLKNADGYAVYADAAGATPVDGTGGSPAVTFARTTTSPLIGTASGLFTKDAANRQGQGFSLDISVPSGYQRSGKNMVSVVTEASANYAVGDMVFYLYDVTNSLLITPSRTTVASGKDVYTAAWDSLATCTTVRLIGHVATTSALAYTLKVDNVIVGPGQIYQGAAMSGWTSYSLTIGATTTPPTKGTIVYDNAYWRQVGDTMEIRYDYRHTTAGSTGTGAYLFPLPSGYTMDTTKITPSTNRLQSPICGHAFEFADNGGGGTMHVGVVSAYDTTRVWVADEAISTASDNAMHWSSTDNARFSLAGLTLGLRWSVPITQFNGQSSAYLGTNDVEYAFNTSTADSDDTTSFGFGPDGIAFGSYTTTRNKTVQFLQPIQASDVVTLEVFIGNRWVPQGANTYLVPPQLNQGNNIYGMGLSNDASSSKVIVSFGHFASAVFSGSTYAASGVAWSTLTANKWRVKKVRGGSAVAFGEATATSLGLVTKPDSEVILVTGNGQGSTATAVRRYATVLKNVGTGATLAQSSTNGDSITILRDMVATITVVDRANSTMASFFGVSKNASSLTTSIDALSAAQILVSNRSGAATAAANQGDGPSCSITCRLAAGDVIRGHGTPGEQDNTSANFVRLHLVEVTRL